MTEKVGFIGTGAMGSAIAGRLVDDFDLHVNDRNPASTEDLVRRGATFAPADEIAKQCRFPSSMVMPRSFSSLSRSVSMPVSARTSAVLP